MRSLKPLTTCKKCRARLPTGTFEGHTRCPRCRVHDSVTVRVAAAVRHAYRHHNFANTDANRRLVAVHFRHITRCAWLRDTGPAVAIIARPITHTRPMGPLNLLLYEKVGTSAELSRQLQAAARLVAQWMRSQLPTLP
jgi:hypothetical protein